MATASKTWTWNSDLESWVDTETGDANAQRDASNGDPNAGSLQMYLTAGRTQSGNGYFDLTTVSWATLFGISSSATVTDVQVLSGTRTYCGLTHWLAGQNFNGASATVYVADGGDQSIWTRSMSTNDSGWNTGSAGTKRTLTTPIAASTNADLRVTLYASTGNTANSTCSVHLDYLTIEITYGFYGTGNVAACAVASATPTKVPAPKQGTANVACCVYTGQGTLGSQEFVSDVTADGEIYMTASTIAAVRDGTGSATATATGLEVGLRYVAGPIYRMGESFIGFNTGGTVPDDGAVLAATLSLYCTSNQTATDSIFEVYAYDWSPTVETADYRTATQILALTKLAIFDTAGLTVSAYNTFSSLTALLAAVSTTGYTYLIVVSDHFATNQTTPTGLEYGLFSDAEVTNQQPKLYVEWLTVVGPIGTKPSGSTKDGTANVVCCAVTAAGSTKPARTSPVVATVASATASRTRARTVEAVAALEATATGTKPSGSTKNATASVVCCAVAEESRQRIRSRTASIVAVAVAAAGSTKPARASVAAVASTGGVTNYSQDFYSSTADGMVQCQSATYATARDGGGTLSYAATAFSNWFCAYLLSGSYRCAELALDFDTSTIGSGSTVTTATISLYGAGNDSASFDIEVRAYDWGTSLGTDDYRTGSQFAALTKLAKFTVSGTNWASSYNVFTSEAAFVENIAKTGTTRVIVCDSNFASNIAPSGDVSQAAALAESANKPKLHVEWTTGTGVQGQRIRSRTASIASAVVANAGSVKPARVAAVAAVEATATGSKETGGATKQGTANVFAVVVASEAHLRTRTRTATVVGVAVASAGSVKPARSSIVACAVTSETRIRVRARTASVVGVALATAGSTKPARSTPVVATVAAAAGQRIRSRTAEAVACAVASAYAAEIETNTASIVVATVATANGSRIRLATSAPVAVAVASAASVKPARSSIVACVEATATGTKGGYKTATAEVAAVAVATAASVKPARSSVVSATEASASGAKTAERTASAVCCAEATASGKNICAVTFTEPHDDDRYEYGTGGTIAWTCTPVENVIFHLYAVYRGTAVEYWLKDIAADGTGSYSTADDFNVPPGQYRMTVVVT